MYNQTVPQHRKKQEYVLASTTHLNSCIDICSKNINLSHQVCLNFRGFTYYKMSNLDNRISNADQLLTQDVEKFCDSVVELYSNISKPILDILIYVQKLTQAIGGQVS